LSNEKECNVLREYIEAVAFNSGNALSDQQLTNEGIPVIVDKCIRFVYSHGCLTEGEQPCSQVFVVVAHTSATTSGLPDFSWYLIPKLGKKCTISGQNVLNVHKISQMPFKYSNWPKMYQHFPI
jgi:hypothetical protein